MSTEKHLEVSIKTLAATILLGLLGNLFLRNVAWGIGFTLYFATIILTCVYLYRRSMIRFSSGVLWLIAPALLFASTFAWRDSSSLRTLNAFCLALIVGLAVLRRHDSSLRIGSVFDYPFRLFGRWFQFVSDGIHLARLDGRWPLLTQRTAGRQLKAGIRGIVIALPLLLLFGGLFMSADAAFENLVESSVRVDGDALFSNLLVSFVCAWLVGGFLRRMFLAVDMPPANQAVKGPSDALGTIEIGVILGALNLLFAIFIGTQLPYFFGGSQVVQSTAGVGYADYARRGFFELSAVAALALPVLLGAHSLMKKDGPAAPKIYKVMSAVLVSLLFVVMASAALRMKLYLDVYGISMLRIYVVASIAWLSGVFIWFVLTVLRDRPQRFAFGGLVMFLATVFALDAINPEALTARLNTTRASSVQVDVGYLNGLSADAIPELTSAQERLPSAARAKLSEGLDRKRDRLKQSDWRSWNLGVEQASRALD